MPYSGTGTYSLVYNWEQDQANGILVRADRMDTQESDIATALSTCLLKDGTQTVTANIPMASFKITGLGTGAAAGDAVNFGQVFTSPSFSSPTFTGTVTFSGATSAGSLASPTFTGTVTVPTAAVGDNSTKAASTAFATALAFVAALPAQASNSGKVVMTDGSTASWTSIYDVPELWMN